MAGTETDLTLWQVIGLNVKSFREARDWSQEMLAVYSGVSRSTVAAIERGDAGQADKIEAIIVCLGLPWLRFVEPPPPPKKGKATRVLLDAIYADSVPAA